MSEKYQAAKALNYYRNHPGCEFDTNQQPALLKPRNGNQKY